MAKRTPPHPATLQLGFCAVDRWLYGRRLRPFNRGVLGTSGGSQRGGLPQAERGNARISKGWSNE